MPGELERTDVETSVCDDWEDHDMNEPVSSE